MTWTELALLTPAVFVAALVSGIMGFGSMVLILVLTAHLLPNLPLSFLVVITLPLAHLQASMIVARQHAHVDRPILFRWILPWMALGSALGIGLHLLIHDEDRWLKLLFGALVLGLSAQELWRVRGQSSSAPLSPWLRAVIYLGAGVTHGLFNAGGPLAVYALSRQMEDKARFRATMSGLWVILNGVMIAIYAATGSLTLQTLWLTLLITPPALLGMFAGEWLHTRVKGRAFRASIFLLLGLGAVAMIASSL